MFTLIDGYNLLHALGMVHAQTGPPGMEFARRRLLDLIHEAQGSASFNVTVIFDAQTLPRGVKEQQVYRGIHVRFAVRYAEADDLLEELIQECSTPKTLTVVSNDHRVQRAARRRGCTVMSCAAYMDWLGQARQTHQQAGATAGGKPENTSAEEIAFWQHVFASLDADPKMRELFEIPWSKER